LFTQLSIITHNHPIAQEQKREDFFFPFWASLTSAWQESHGIDCSLAGGVNLEMEVGAGAKTGATHLGDWLALLNSLAATHQQTAVMGIESGATIGVTQFHQIAITARIPTGGDYFTGSRGHNRCTHWTGDIDAAMRSAPAPTETGS
jgi:hypothetical protein